MTRSIERFLCDSWASCSYIADGENGHELCALFSAHRARWLGYYMAQNIVEKFNSLSRGHQRHRQTDRQTTDRRNCDDNSQT